MFRLRHISVKMDSKLAEDAIFYAMRGDEKKAMAAVRALRVADQSEPKNLMAVVVNAPIQVANAAFGALIELFGEDYERMDEIVSELKRLIQPDHQNYKVVKSI